MIPVVAIVGRPNVGKSSLLNAFARRLISIVDDMPGLTRDRVSTELEIAGRTVEFVDTGGIGLVDTQHLEHDVEFQIQAAIEMADVLLFTVDVRDGIAPLDRKMAEMLRKKTDKPVLILANKADADKFDTQVGEFYKLGFEDVFPVSAKNNRNLKAVLERVGDVLESLPDPETRTPPAMKLAIVGKRNAGKSTLVNTLAQTDRCIVSELPGTTRDSVDVRFRFRDQEFIAIDTAGLRRQRAVENTIEYYSQHRSLRSVRHADVVLLLLDCKEVTSLVDKKTAEAILEAGKPVIIGVNKWDTNEQGVATERYEEYVRKKLPGLSFAPVAYLSGKTGSNVWQVIGLAQELYEQSLTRVSTGELNRALEQILQRRPPMVNGRRAKVFYGTQIGVSPPTIVLFVNEPDLVSAEYRRFMVNRFRELLPFSEVPVKLIFRARKRGEELAK